MDDIRLFQHVLEREGLPSIIRYETCQLVKSLILEGPFRKLTPEQIEAYIEAAPAILAIAPHSVID